MREAKERVDRSAAQEPQRPAPPDGIEQQRARLERHDYEGRQWDRDDVRAHSVEARPVEMVEREWDQRDFNRKPGRNQRANLPAEARHRSFLAALEQPPRPGGRMERNDRGHGSKAHLEAWPGQRFGPEYEDDQGPGSDQ